jgi:hypothetical protein
MSFARLRFRCARTQYRRWKMATDGPLHCGNADGVGCGPLSRCADPDGTWPVVATAWSSALARTAGDDPTLLHAVKRAAAVGSPGPVGGPAPSSGSSNEHHTGKSCAPDLRRPTGIGCQREIRTVMNSLSSARFGLRALFGKLLSQPSSRRLPEMIRSASIDSQVTWNGSPMPTSPA